MLRGLGEDSDLLGAGTGERGFKERPIDFGDLGGDFGEDLDELAETDLAGDDEDEDLAREITAEAIFLDSISDIFLPAML